MLNSDAMENLDGNTAEEQGTDGGASGMDRRSLIKTGAAVGAAAWALPQVVSMSSAAAASASDCVSAPPPLLIAPAQPSVLRPNGATLVGAVTFCYFTGGTGTLIAGNSLGTANLAADDYLAIRVTRPDTTQASFLVGSYWSPWNISSPTICPNLAAWAAANLPGLTQLSPPPGWNGAGQSSPINITSLLQSSATTANTVEVFIYNCSGLSGYSDIWLA